MDGGPFRSQRPADRKVSSRSEPTNWQPEEPQPVKEEPKAAYRPPTSHHVAKEEKRSLKRIILPIIITLVVIALGVIAWTAWSGTQKTVATGIDSNKYQAVFFTNGQVYFGKLRAFNENYMQLTDIYYLQTQTTETDSKNLQQTASNESNVQLIKLGDEIHGPEDEMIISRDQVLFYENLKADGNVAQSISKYKKP